MAVPASQTKHLSYLLHPLPRDPSTTLHIQQQSSTNDASNTGTGTTGTTLWLGAQVMAAYLQDTLTPSTSEAPRRRVMELGAGVGFLALVVASLGYDILATDVEPVLSGVLKGNIGRGKGDGWGRVEVRGLDWFNVGQDWDLDWKCSEGSPLTQRGDSAQKKTTNVEKEVQQSTSLSPPFEYILTTDTLYHPTLLEPLLRTLQVLSTHPDQGSPPPILVALERRDPALIDSALERAKEVGFDVKRVSKGRVAKAVSKAWGWEKDDEGWEGIEIWRWKWRGMGE